MHPLAVGRTAKLSVRLCPRCVACEHRRKRLAFIAGMVVCYIVGSVGGLGFVRRDSPDYVWRFWVLFIGPIAATAVGAIVARSASRWFCGPVRVRNYQDDFNTVEVRFRNSGYANLLIDFAARAAIADARRAGATALPLPPRQSGR